MKQEFKEWLEKNYSPNTLNTKVSQISKIESVYGDIDKYFFDGTIQNIVKSLTYSANDERENKPNPSKINITGNLRNGLNSYKSGISFYRKFLNEYDFDNDEIESSSEIRSLEIVEEKTELSKQKFALERDMQKALRENILSLDSSLVVIDDGAERAVDSGFIDITCEDSDGLVVIELKAGKADSRAIGQILGYMGDLQEEESRSVRGILVAHDFDKRAKAAARVVSTLTLKRYSIEFKFLNSE